MDSKKMLTLDLLRLSKNTNEVIKSIENIAEFTKRNQLRVNKYRHHIQHRICVKNFSYRIASKTRGTKTGADVIGECASSYIQSQIPLLPHITGFDKLSKKKSVTYSDNIHYYQFGYEHWLLEQTQKKQDFFHMKAFEGILNLEEKFIESLQRGVQQYSRPLRHCIMISSAQHQTLFQNIEKILAISEYQLNQLISNGDRSLLNLLNIIEKLYRNKLRMFSEIFDIYLNGIEKSFDLLENLTKASATLGSLDEFLMKLGNEIKLDLRTFLLLPLYYAVSVYNRLLLIRTKAALVKSDYQSLSSLLDSLEGNVKKAMHILDQLRAEATNFLKFL